ncbi:MAG TPA: hypothetical protein VJ464_13395 [Blastocatellia bacterium]|nr:hypothetical protein [Blastocatellia bacterium]
MALYLIANGASPTTAAQVAVTTGTSIKTLLQVKASATVVAKIKEWGISFDGSAAATPIKCELLETDVAATVTAAAAADINKLDGPALAGGDPTTNLIPVGTTSTGYTSTSEGSIASVRMFDVQFIAPTNQYVKQFPLGLEPVIQVSKFGRIRVTAGAAVNAYCYMVIEV